MMFVSKKYIIPYLAIAVIFSYVFTAIKCYYIKDSITTDHPIDVHFYATHKYPDVQYFQQAKSAGYDHPHYYTSFFLLDLLFPVVYSLLFLSCLQCCNNAQVRKWLTLLIWAGFVLDYCENFSFAIYLSVNWPALGIAVASFSAIKTIVFIANGIIALAWMVYGIVGLFKKAPVLPSYKKK